VIWERDYDRPLVTTMSFVWDEVMAGWWPQHPEVWLNPADWHELGEPDEYQGAPVKTSIGIPRGSMRVFDRDRLVYLPPTRPDRCSA
jgi:hypothetical protein